VSFIRVVPDALEEWMPHFASARLKPSCGTDRTYLPISASRVTVAGPASFFEHPQAPTAILRQRGLLNALGQQQSTDCCTLFICQRPFGSSLDLTEDIPPD
jgi:hypothetical protein